MMNYKPKLPATHVLQFSELMSTNSQTDLSSNYHHNIQNSDSHEVMHMEHPRNLMNYSNDSTISIASTASKLLFTTNTAQLALIVKYILENEESFEKYKHKSQSIYAAFINYKIKGKMLFELTSHEFYKELPWVRNIISAQIYDHLHTLSDHQIHEILITHEHNTTPIAQNTDHRTTAIVLPPYLPHIDIQEASQIAFTQYTEHQFHIFVYILLRRYKYEATLTESLMRALLDTHLNGERFNALKRTDFCRTLKVYHIKGAVASKLYKLIVTHAGNIAQYIQTHHITLSTPSYDDKSVVGPGPSTPMDANDVVEQLVSLGYGTKQECMNAAQSVVNPLDINDVLSALQSSRDRDDHKEEIKSHKFKTFVSNLLLSKEYDEEVIASISNAVHSTKMDATQFEELKRVEFCRMLKAYDVKAGVASKTYKLVASNLAHMEEYDVKKEETLTTLHRHSTLNRKSLHVLWNSTNSADTDIRSNNNDDAYDDEEEDSRNSVDYMEYSNLKTQGNASLDTADLKQESSPSNTSTETEDAPIKYNETVIDQLVSLGYGTRHQCIEASRFTVHYWDINEVVETLKKSTTSAAIKDPLTMAMLDGAEFETFVHAVCVANEVNPNDIDLAMKGISRLHMDGKVFMSLSRGTFGRQLKEYGIKGGVAAKLYKLIMAHSEDIAAYLVAHEAEEEEDPIPNDGILTAYEISEIAIGDFQHSAYRMLKNMNQSLKRNAVSGETLTRHYTSKEYLQEYLADYVRSKSVHILCDMLWSDYMRGGDEKKSEIGAYDRKALLKYFISLCMYQVKITIIEHKLNQTKCESLTRKALCTLMVRECGLSVGAATNIVERIYENINK